MYYRCLSGTTIRLVAENVDPDTLLSEINHHEQVSRYTFINNITNIEKEISGLNKDIQRVRRQWDFGLDTQACRTNTLWPC